MVWRLTFKQMHNRYESYPRFRGVLLRHLASAVLGAAPVDDATMESESTMARIRRLRVLIIGCGKAINVN